MGAEPGRPRPRDVRVLGAIALGGALGAMARYAVAEVVGRDPDRFPWATFGTNVTGAFALGAVLVVLLRRYPPHRYLLPFVATGVLGSFTTFSTFAVETNDLLDHGQAGLAVGYVAATVVAGLLAAATGIAVGRRTRWGAPGA